MLEELEEYVVDSDDMGGARRLVRAHDGDPSDDRHPAAEDTVSEVRAGVVVGHLGHLHSISCSS